MAECGAEHMGSRSGVQHVLIGEMEDMRPRPERLAVRPRDADFRLRIGDCGLQEEKDRKKVTNKNKADREKVKQ
jgi:hypothetical protein